MSNFGQSSDTDNPTATSNPVTGLYSLTSSNTPDRIINRIARLEMIAPQVLRGNATAAQTAFNQYSPLSSSGIVGGKINIANTDAITFVGSMGQTVVDGQFSVGAPTAATSSTIYWDGTNSSRRIVLRRADGTNFPIPGGTIIVTGLTVSLQYTYMAYWIPGNVCTIAWAQGDTGTPQIAFSPSISATLFNQGGATLTQAGHEKLGVFSFTQPASGTSSPTSPSSPPSRNPGMCVRLGTEIDPLGPIKADEWRTEMTHQDDWLALGTLRGLRLDCTPSHPLYTDNGKTAAEKLKVGDWVITEIGMEKLVKVDTWRHRCTKQQVYMNYGHLFWANGFLSSNAKNQPDQG